MSGRRTGASALLTIVVATLMAMPMNPAVAEPTVEMTLTVTKVADTDDGICNADCSLREAIAVAASTAGRDTVTFAAGLTGRTLVLKRGQIVLGSAVRIDGAGRAITISGNDLSRIFDVSGAARVELIGLTLRRGHDVGGGAIRSVGELSVVATVIADSVSDSVSGGDGGGIQSAGVLRVTNSIIRNNQAGYGDGGRLGGGGISSSGELHVTASRILDNLAFGNGAGVTLTGTGFITDTLISRNEGLIDGGGIGNSGTLTLTDSTVSNNHTPDLGGGILNGSFISSGAMTIVNSTISGNDSCCYVGGGIYNSGGSTMTIQNSTITRNSASFFGASGGGTYGGGLVDIRNSIVAGNAADGAVTEPSADCAGGGVQTSGFNVVGAQTGCPSGTEDATVTPAQVNNTVLLPLADYGGLTPTHALRFAASNPALDIGGTCSATDQRGLPAPVPAPSPGPVAACDAGSVESGAAVTASVSISPAVDPVLISVAGAGFTYTVTITNTSATQQTYDYWSRAIRPDGTATATLYGAGSVTLGSGASVTRTLAQRLSGPPGLYRYDFFVGTFSTRTVNGADSIAVSKT